MVVDRDIKSTPTMPNAGVSAVHHEVPVVVVISVVEV
jgi:hypothetical protein